MFNGKVGVVFDYECDLQSFMSMATSAINQYKLGLSKKQALKIALDVLDQDLDFPQLAVFQEYRDYLNDEITTTTAIVNERTHSPSAAKWFNAKINNFSDQLAVVDQTIRLITFESLLPTTKEEILYTAK